MKCTVCGTENPENARFCGICGTPFAEQTQAEIDSSAYVAASINTDDSDAEKAVSESNELSETNEANEANEASTDSMPSAEPSLSETAGASNTQDLMPSAPSPLPPMSKPSAYGSAETGRSYTSSANTARSQMSNAGKHEKEKKVVSLSIAVICIIAVFILSAVCGVLTQLYMRKSGAFPHSGTVYSSYNASEEENVNLGYV